MAGEIFCKPRGRVRGYRVSVGQQPHPKLWIPQTRWCPNDVLFDWAAVVGNALLGKQGYSISTMLIEYQNMADIDDVADIPVIDRAEAMNYFDSLAFSADRDYLRVPVIAGTLTSGGDDFPNGNILTWFAMTQGIVGVHGKAFSDTANSKVIGGAMVATPAPEDPTQDLVLARFYFEADDQLPKLPTSQVGVEWTWTLN